VDVDRMHQHCAAKPGAWPDWPWEEHGHPVFKVGPGERGRIFAFLSGGGVGVKAARSRDVADEWLQRYPESASVMAYIGRSGWNTVRLAASVPDEEILELVDASYDLVVAKLPRSRRPPASD
jgi:predicted DNA-binding protein (MmcQ/YjbR family)